MTIKLTDTICTETGIPVGFQVLVDDAPAQKMTFQEVMGLLEQSWTDIETGLRANWLWWCDPATPHNEANIARYKTMDFNLTSERKHIEVMAQRIMLFLHPPRLYPHTFVEPNPPTLFDYVVDLHCYRFYPRYMGNNLYWYTTKPDGTEMYVAPMGKLSSDLLSTCVTYLSNQVPW